MSKGQRLTFAAIAAAIAIVAVIVLAGGDGTDEEPATVATTPAATATPEGTAEATPTPTPEPRPEVTEIEVAGGKVKGGVAELEVDEGDTVRFAVTSDVADHVHVHGYDKLADVAAGGRVRFTFEADIVGIFEIELEDAGLQVARLRVNQ